ncbi:M12 family metallopeptidase [Nonlabens xiamenensis]|uniref:M12 family metallopeptidase n=1 Tax=Nonlabens xiamenensis TaxID=2341043 RepID=UPI000F607F8F|nr:M12 family metallopeptidase [Nonlabens xiamenensis]
MYNTKKWLALIALVAFWSCDNDELVESPELPEKNFVSKNFNGTILEVEDLGGGIYQLGDMRITENQFLPLDAVISPYDAPDTDFAKLNQADRIRKWNNNTIVYSIESNFSQNLLDNIQAAMDEWSSKTDIRFKERTNEGDYVRIISNGATCNCGSAYLGVVNFNGFIGTIELGSNSSASVITHEIGHTLGYTHEQNRADRDNYITILPQNILSNALGQYEVSSGSIPLTSTLDYESIMMYTSNTFGNGNGPTMVRNDNGQPVAGSQGELTALDVAGTNVAYPPIDDTITVPDPVDICDGVAEYQRRRYNVGDRVTYFGYLWEREPTGWRRIGQCGTSN